MAQVRRIAIDGHNGCSENSFFVRLGSEQNKDNNDVIAKILNDLEWLERILSGEVQSVGISKNCVDFINSRELGNQRLQRASMSTEYGVRHLIQNQLLKEREIRLEKLNKVFCSQWLSDTQIVFGTKCNKLIVFDTVREKMVQIPNLCSSESSIPPENPCGIHAVEVNPSRTLLATGGQNSNDVAVYKLPTLDPVCVGEGAHRDWIFDIKWLDDEFFVSGSRDTTIALWRVREPDDSLLSQLPFPKYSTMSPLAIKVCKNAEKVRALIFNQHYKELVALSLNAYLHLWDAQTFKQKFSRKLPFCMENVCLTQQSEHEVYAVGSKSHITLLDSRTLQPVQKVPSKHQGCGIRSLSFLGDLLTIGTGVGVLMFYDIRAVRYLDQTNGSVPAVVKCGSGWVYPDDLFREVFLNVEYSPAIYTHCFDSSGTRLFTAGGPLPASLHGNYAGLWQ